MSQIYGKQIFDGSVGLVKWDLSGAQGTVTLGTGSMIGVNDAPTNGTDLANKNYVDSIASGLDPKESVSVKSTANLGAISGLLTIDGYTLLDGERVLLTDQTDQTENGIYDAAVGAWTRSADSDGTPANEVTLGNFTFVGTGNAWGSSGWVLGQTDAPDGDVQIQPGTHSQVWVQFSDAAALSEGAGIDITGQVVSTDITPQGGLTFSISGDSGTLEIEAGDGIEVTAGGQVGVDLLTNGGLNINGAELEVNPTIAGAGSTWTSGVLNVIGGTGVTVNANDIQIDFSDFSVLAGDGLAWDATPGSEGFDVGGGTGITVNADDIEIDFNDFAQLAGDGLVWDGGVAEIDVNTGDGLTINTDQVEVVAGTGITVDTSGVNVDGDSLSGTGVTWNSSLGQFEVSISGDISSVDAGAGLTGGGTQGAVVLDIGAGNGITVNADDIEVTAGTGVTVDTSGVNVDGSSLAGTGVTWNSSLGQFEVSIAGDIESVEAGAGLTGGGTSGAVTLDVGAGTGITVNADNIEVDGSSLAGTNIGWSGTQFTGNAGTVTDVTAGAGLTGGGSVTPTLDIGAGNGITVNADDIEVDPGTGITVDGTGVNSNADGTLTANMTALGLTAGTDSIQEALTALLGNQTSLNSEQTNSAVASGGNNIDTGYSLVGNPATDHEVNLYINGQLQRYGTAFDYYFSSDGTIGGARAIDEVTTADALMWNATQANFDLAVTDLVTITYDEVLV